MANSPEETDEVTIALPRRMLVFLRSIASTTGEQLETMVAEAIRMYVRAQEWKIEEIGKAVEEAARGEFISDEKVEAHLRDLLGEPSPEAARTAQTGAWPPDEHHFRRGVLQHLGLVHRRRIAAVASAAAFSQQPVHYQGVESRRSMRTGWSRWQRSWGIGLCEGPGAEYIPHVPRKAASDIPE